MSLGSVFAIACVWILIRDRRDWFNYVVVVLATLFFAGTNLGNDIGPWLTARAAWLDAFIVGLFNNGV